MVSLDEQIQKDKQKQKGHKGGRNQSIGNDRRNRKFNRGPTDKHRGIRKNDRERKVGKFRRDREDRGPRRSNQDKRQNSGRPHPKSSRDEKGGRRISRISRPPRKDSTNSNEAKNEAAQEKGRTLKVMGLNPDFTNEDLNKLFSTEGALQKCLIEQDNFGRSMTTAIVKYHNASSAKSAIANLNQHKVMNSILTVEPYKNIKRR